jgi:hypothetical protein
MYLTVEFMFEGALQLMLKQGFMVAPIGAADKGRYAPAIAAKTCNRDNSESSLTLSGI